MTLVQCCKINLFRHQANEKINPPLCRTSLLLQHKPHSFHLQACPALSLISPHCFVSSHSPDASSPPWLAAGWSHHQLMALGLTASSCRGMAPVPSAKAAHCPSSSSTFLGSSGQGVVIGLGVWGRCFQDLCFLQTV